MSNNMKYKSVESENCCLKTTILIPQKSDIFNFNLNRRNISYEYPYLKDFQCHWLK